MAMETPPRLLPWLRQVRVQVFQAGSDQPLVLGAKPAKASPPLQAPEDGIHQLDGWRKSIGL